MEFDIISITLLFIIAYLLWDVYNSNKRLELIRSKYRVMYAAIEKGHKIKID